ncbi:MAG TPA: response regulator [Pirellulales bacterium]|jgi:two-component system CheB/CheR fusion protein|nr:response regulator [Pirellulales bacterium]
MRRQYVLVVEDNTGAAQMLAKLLKTIWGHDVELAHDGLEALERVQQRRPDVMLLDIGLPQLNGFQVAERLRDLPESRPTLLVAVTGYGSPDDFRRSAELGFDDHLVKPVSIAALEAVFQHQKLAG